MQNTRLSTFVTTVGAQVNRELANPWRRLAVLFISLLLGIYAGIAASAIAGQLAYWDITVAALLVVICEVIGLCFHTNRFKFRRTVLGEALYMFKTGITYSLFLIAFMLGS